MKALAELQSAFQRGLLLDETDTILALVCDSATAPASTRIRVYQEAYRLRLRAALASNYPRLQQLLGDDSFAEIADVYIDRHPSRSFSVRWFGDELAEDLRSGFPSQPWLAELARWEWTIAAAFDAVDTTALDIATLSRCDAEEWPQLRFAFHSSVKQLVLHTNTVEIYRALLDEAAPPAAVRLPNERHWLIWRQELTTRYRSIATDEARALTAVLDGASFGEMCTLLCESHTEQTASLRAATLLKQWLDEDLICSVAL